MDKKTTYAVSKEEWTNKMAAHITHEMFKLFDLKDEQRGPALTKALVYAVLSRYVGTLVLEALMDEPENDVSKEELYEHSLARYEGVLNDIQDAVALGFQRATTHYSATPTSYFCKIKMVPEPLNKEPC